jgi:catechol 2,3-dioxygenase-like lactoylglutathione lyase family enzyme
MPPTHLFAGIPVRDRDAASGWYERLTGRPPDLVPNAGEAAWQVTGDGWVYIIEDAPRAGTALNTLLVDDLDAYLRELAGRGIPAGPVQAHAGARHVAISDPDGNRLQLGQPHRSA